MAISAFATIRFVKHLNRLKISLFVLGDYHLGNALAILYYEVFLGEVDQHDADLTAVVGIDGAG